MAEEETGMSVVPGGDRIVRKSIALPRPIQGMVERWRVRKERERVLSENEQAKERMSDIAWRLRKLVDSQEFRNQEDTRDKRGYSYIPGVEPGFGYGIRTERDKKTDETFMVEVYARPMDIEHYSTGMGDGYWRIYFNNDHWYKPKKGERNRLEWANTDVHGDLYLGEDARGVIESVSVDNLATRVQLAGVDFGGYPSAHVTVIAFDKGEDGSKYLGPIGRVRELNVDGIARAEHPVKDHLVDIGSSKIPVDNDFRGAGVHLEFDRGEMEFEAKRETTPDGKDVLAFKFTGERKRLANIQRGSVRAVESLGLETRTMMIPADIVDGHRVISLFEKCVDNLITAFKTKPLLEPASK